MSGHRECPSGASPPDFGRICLINSELIAETPHDPYEMVWYTMVTYHGVFKKVNHGKTLETFLVFVGQIWVLVTMLP